MQLKPNSAAPMSKRYKEQARAFHMGASGSPHQGLLIGHTVFHGLFCKVTSAKHSLCL